MVASCLLILFEPLAESALTKNGPAKIEHIKASGLNRITLTTKAMERLDIKTELVHEKKIESINISRGNNRGSYKVIPYAAVLYDINGNAWTYINPEPSVFIRHSITIDYIVGKTAFLSEGPPLGTAVVTVGGGRTLWSRNGNRKIEGL